MGLTEHARAELQRAGLFEQDLALAEALIDAVTAIEGYVAAGYVHAGDLVEPLSTLLAHGTLSELTDDPGEWADRYATTGRVLWQNRRNPYAFSYDAGRSYFLLAELQAYSPYPSPTYRTAATVAIPDSEGED
ncbi:MAG: hypothetical protein ABWY93_18800 [Mycobacterium sp.]